MKKVKTFVGTAVSICILISAIFFPYSATAQQPCEISSSSGAAIRVDTVGYNDAGDAVVSADMRFRGKLYVPKGAQFTSFGYVYTLSQYLNDNVKPPYDMLENGLYSSQGFVLEKDCDYGYSPAAKSITLEVFNVNNEPEQNGNYVKRVDSVTGDAVYTFNLVMTVKQEYFVTHPFSARPYYTYIDSEGNEQTVYGTMYSRCIKYVAYTAYNAKVDGKYVENVDTRVTLAEILGYRDPGSTGYY